MTFKIWSKVTGNQLPNVNKAIVDPNTFKPAVNVCILEPIMSLVIVILFLCVCLEVKRGLFFIYLACSVPRWTWARNEQSDSTSGRHLCDESVRSEYKDPHTAMKWRFYIGLLWGLLVCILYGIFFISFDGKLLFAHQSKSVSSISEDLISYSLSCNVGSCDHRSVCWLPDMLFLIRFPHSSPARLATWSSSNGYPIQHHHTYNTFLSFVSLVFRLLLKRK